MRCDMLKSSPNGACWIDNVMSVNWDDVKIKLMATPDVRRAYGPDEIKSARKSMSLTQKQLADLMGIQEQKLGRWERGDSPISPEGAKLIELLTIQYQSDQ